MPRTKHRAVTDRATSRTLYLQDRAAALREVAETIDVWSIRDRVLALAEECVQLARLVEKEGARKSLELTAGRRSRQSPRFLGHGREPFFDSRVPVSLR